MKHVFIINPTAGKRDCTARVMDMAKDLAARRGLETKCILTRRPGHAMETAGNLARSGQEVRLYACGGDGTMNEVANGAAGCANAAVFDVFHLHFYVLQIFFRSPYPGARRP